LGIGRPSAPSGPPREHIGLLQAEADEFHTEIAALVHAAAPWLPELPGVGPISARQLFKLLERYDQPALEILLAA